MTPALQFADSMGAQLPNSADGNAYEMPPPSMPSGIMMGKVKEAVAARGGDDDSERESGGWQLPSSDVSEEVKLAAGQQAGLMVRHRRQGSYDSEDGAFDDDNELEATGSEEREWSVLNGAQDDEDDDAGDMEEDGEPPAFCVNCTEELYQGQCMACGHNMEHDALIFSTRPSGECVLQAPPPAGHVALLWDERMELHEEGKANPHPERPDRIRAVMARILSSGLSERCTRVNCPDATHDQLAAVHTKELIEFVDAAASGRASGHPIAMTPDTYVNAHTYKCARLAAGGSAEVAAMVARGDAAHGAAIVRPPGHHAESNMSMGFCFFNNAAVAAKAAQAAGAQRVLILDWDVHHGNGTQHIFEDENSVMYMSIHRYDGGAFYPGTGAVDEVGYGHGSGYSVNVPWDGPNMTNGDYMGALHHVLLPVAYEFNPDLIIVSAGFDAAEGDPIGGCQVTPECFAHMTALLKSVAPIVLLLEGGYNLLSTASSTEACLRVLLGETPPHLPGARHATPLGLHAIHAALLVQARYWRSLRPAAYAVAEAQRQLQQQRAAQTAAAAAQRQAALALMRPRETPAVAASVTQQRGVPPVLAAVAAKQALPASAPRTSGTKGRKRYGQRRAHQVLAAIRKKAIRAFWRRHKRILAQRQKRAGSAANH